LKTPSLRYHQLLLQPRYIPRLDLHLTQKSWKILKSPRFPKSSVHQSLLSHQQAPESSSPRNFRTNSITVREILFPLIHSLTTTPELKNWKIPIYPKFPNLSTQSPISLQRNPGSSFQGIPRTTVAQCPEFIQLNRNPNTELPNRRKSWENSNISQISQSINSVPTTAHKATWQSIGLITGQ
jgi:hypothetical protein